MRSAVVLAGVLLGLSACSARAPAPRERPTRSYSSRSGYARGLTLSGARLRADTPAYTERAVPWHPSYEPQEESYGPTGTSGSAYGPGECWGTLDPVAGYVGGYAGPVGAVQPGLRPPSDERTLQPASPYRGPADSRDVIERPGLVSGNDTYRAK